MRVEKIPVTAYVIRGDGLVKVDLAALPLPKDAGLKPTWISLPPLQIAGNHKHARREYFFTLDESLEIHWVDSAGHKHVSKMKEKEGVYLFAVYPEVPHAIVNSSKTSTAQFLEFAMEDGVAAEPCIVFSSDMVN